MPHVSSEEVGGAGGSVIDMAAPARTAAPTTTAAAIFRAALRRAREVQPSIPRIDGFCLGIVTGPYHRAPQIEGLTVVATRAERYADAVPNASDLTLYHFPACPYCRRVRTAMQDLELTMADRDIHRDADAQADVVRHTGRGTVPALRIESADSEEWMTESMVIVRYLYDRFGNGKKPSLWSMITPMHKILALAAVGWLVWQVLN